MAKKSDDIQNKYDSLLLSTVNRIDDKVTKLTTDLQKNTDETKRINGGLKVVTAKVAKHDAQLNTPKKESIRDLPAILSDPKMVILLIIVASIVLTGLYLYGGAKGYPLPSPLSK